MQSFTSMTPEFFESGTSVDEYLRDQRTYRSVVQALVRDADADDADAAALAGALAGFPGPANATVFTESWCGDSACNLPIVRSLFAKAGVPFRVFDRASHPGLNDWYRGRDVTHIPVVSLWSADGTEIARWVEAPKAIEPRKAAWKAEHPRMMELYAIKDGDKAAENEFARLYRGFVEDMAGWYRDGLWKETTREIVATVPRR